MPQLPCPCTFNSIHTTNHALADLSSPMMKALAIVLSRLMKATDAERREDRPTCQDLLRLPLFDASTRLDTDEGLVTFVLRASDRYKNDG